LPPHQPEGRAAPTPWPQGQVRPASRLSRQSFAEVPPRVEYTITEKGRRVVPIIEMLREFGHELQRKP